MKTNHYSVLPLVGAAIMITTLVAGSALAASTAIGLAVANGSFQVDQAKVWGSSSLFEGSTVQTAVTASQLQVNGGANVRLAADSRVKVYRSRMVLEQGFTELRAASGFTVEARSLAITPRTREGVTRIKLDGASKVTVAALGGSVDVKNSGGLLVARVAAGSSLDFEQQTTGGASASGAGSSAQTGAGAAGSTASGASGSTAAGASGAAGSTAAGAGSTAGATAAGASGAAGAAGAGAAGATGAAAAGISVGTIAIIGGVAVAATVGGLAATGSLPGQSQSTPSASQ